MKPVIILATILISVLSPTASAQSSLRVSPINTYLSAQPGSTQRVKITLTNPTNKPLTAQVTAHDFQAGSEYGGEPQLLPVNNSSHSLANWLSDSNLHKQITVPANQSVVYEAVFRVPQYISAKSYYGAIVFNIDSQASVKALIYITVDNPDTTFNIASIALNDSDDAAKPYGSIIASINNTSEGLILPSFIMKISDDSGTILAREELMQQDPVLPGATRNYTINLSNKLPKKPLTITITSTDQHGKTADKSIRVDLSKPENNTHIIENEINPNNYTLMASAVFVGIVLVMAVTYFLYRKRTY